MKIFLVRWHDFGFPNIQWLMLLKASDANSALLEVGRRFPGVVGSACEFGN